MTSFSAAIAKAIAQLQIFVKGGCSNTNSEFGILAAREASYETAEAGVRLHFSDLICS
ncbi:hypothetical protein H6F43_13050 [Leptolyngbya sp. FACHB-36]|uniref:hypothetical protein n=1 Tax=Leptolyngbya sp. FACHB-36 TaxID=2692808 RepID=UPI001681AA0B|nr:hypothetical protein [Leptolyngbya sp. FACHB-36]MBD2021108.1 hypothetical protein [Leptolyngbya sp. FACHB-36]